MLIVKCIFYTHSEHIKPSSKRPVVVELQSNVTHTVAEEHVKLRN